MRKMVSRLMKYEPEADILSWEVSDQPIDSAREMGNLVVHFDKDQVPVLVEVLEARKFLRRTQKVITRPSKVTA